MVEITTFLLIYSIILQLRNNYNDILPARYCDNCTYNEVCLANDENLENVPACRKKVHFMDPTGCGGLCEIGKQVCHRLGHGAYRYSFFITIYYIFFSKFYLAYINSLLFVLGKLDTSKLVLSHLLQSFFFHLH